MVNKNIALTKDIALIVSSFDGYSDLWKPLDLNYSDKWNNCPFSKYIISNFKIEHLNSFNILKTGEDVSWSYNLKVALDMIEEKYVLLTFDDLFLKKEVDNKLIEQYIEYFLKYDMNYLQFYPSISKIKKINNYIYEKVKFTKYRNSTVWSLWKKEVLYDLLEEKENAWEFEIRGNERANKYDKFYVVNKSPFSYYNLVVKGKYIPIYFNKLHNLYNLDKNKREKLDYKSTMKYFFINYSYELLKKVNRWI